MKSSKKGSNEKTTFFSLPTELKNTIHNLTGKLSYYNYRAIRELSPLDFDSRYLVLSNVSNEDEIQYFKPVKGRSCYFKDFKSLRHKVEQHLQKTKLPGQELTVFIEYKENYPNYDQVLSTFYTDQNTLGCMTSNTGNLRGKHLETDLANIVKFITERKIRIELFLTCPFTETVLEDAVKGPISLIYTPMSLTLHTFRFLYPSDRTAKVSHFIFDIEKKIKIPSGNFDLLMEVYKNYDRYMANDKLDQAVTLSFNVQDTEFKNKLLELAPAAFHRLKVLTIDPKVEKVFRDFVFKTQFSQLEVLKIHEMNLDAISHCSFPKLHTLKLHENYSKVQIWDNDFPKLKYLQLTGCRTIGFKQNRFGQEELEEVIYDMHPRHGVGDFAELVSKAKRVRLGGMECDQFKEHVMLSLQGKDNLEFDQIFDLMSDEVHRKPRVAKTRNLRQLVLGELQFQTLQRIISTCKLDTLTEFKVFSITSAGYFNESEEILNCENYFENKKFRHFRKNQPALDLRKLENVETVYILNHNIRKVIVSKKLKQIIFSTPSEHDESYKYSKYYAFDDVLDNEMTTEPDLSVEINMIDVSNMKEGGVVTLSEFKPVHPFNGNRTKPNAKLDHLLALQQSHLDNTELDESTLPEFEEYAYFPSEDESMEEEEDDDYDHRFNGGMFDPFGFGGVAGGFGGRFQFGRAPLTPRQEEYLRDVLVQNGFDSDDEEIMEQLIQQGVLEDLE